MKTLYSETAKFDPNCEIRLGIASWDDGTETAKSIKYASLDKNGKVTRHGEFPVEALPQMLDVAIREGNFRLCP